MGHNIADINGLFQPMTLSIVETAQSDSWRKTIRNKKLRSEKPREINSDLFSELVSIHEHDHFLRHCSSGLGMLLTIILNLQHYANYSLYFTDKHHIDQTMSHIRDLEYTMHCMAISNDISQESAVKQLNDFYTRHFEVNDAFVTRQPKLPANAETWLTYSSILEASAVFSELGITTQEGYNLADLLKVIRAKDRNYKLYFQLVQYLMSELRFIPACKLVCMYALDVPVPGLTTDFDKKIFWDEFNPSYRILNFTNFLKERLEEVGFLKPSNVKYYIDHEFIAQYQMFIFESLERISYGVGQKSFYTRGLEGQRINMQSFIDQQSQIFKTHFTHSILPKHGGVISHLFNSYNSLIQECANLPLNYYCHNFSATADDRFQIETLPYIDKRYFSEEVAKGKYDSSTYALFSILKGEYTSVYLNKHFEWMYETILNGRIRRMVMECTYKKMNKEEATKYILSDGKWSYKEIQEQYEVSVSLELNAIYNGRYS